jgi:hypothetical protein
MDKILTGVKHGNAALEPFLQELSKDGEFIVEGKASESP